MTMALESIPGDLRAYAQLKPESMLHGYELTNERRTCPDEKIRAELRNNPFYTADGQLYTTKKIDVLWGITLRAQNLVLQHLADAYRQLTQNRNYFPPAAEAKVSFKHKDTMVVDLKGLKLVKDNDEYGHFVLDPQKVKKLNSEQKRAAVRLFGPDEENFGLNMEMLKKEGKTPLVFALMPSYVQQTLKANNAQYLGRASWLNSFNVNSYFSASGRDVNDHARVRGVRREEEARSAAALKNAVPSAPVAPSEMKTATMEDI